jgi:photosystem II stability/assembly factor-like uncharacterized protein
VLAATGWLVVASDTGLFRSDDHGLHWDRVQLPPGYKTVRELVPLCPSLTGAIVDRRILLSRDGTRWHPTAVIPGSPEIFGLTGIGCSGLLAATASGLLRSDDLGQSWHQTGTDLRGKMVQSVASESISGLHFAAAAGIVYQSRDGGDSWQEVAPDARMGRILQILPLAGDANRLFVLTEGRGVYELESSLSGSSQADAARVK